MSKFKIFTDSASDIPTELRKANGIEYYPMGLVVDGKEMIADLDFETYSSDEFYSWLKEGRKVKTYLITVEVFADITRKWFKEGYDILYLGCSSALTGSINSFNLAKDLLAEEFPERRMVSIPTYAASATLGMMVLDAAKRQQEGKSLDEVAKWVEDNRFFYNQFCTVDTLSYLRDAGRIKGAKAFFGNLMGVKPIFISDRKGNNFVIGKEKGTKNSLNAIFDYVAEAWEKDKHDEIWILHSCCPERAEYLKKRFEDELGCKKVIVGILGPIVGTSCGPGAIAGFCFGKEVVRYDGDNL